MPANISRYTHGINVYVPAVVHSLKCGGNSLECFKMLGMLSPELFHHWEAVENHTLSSFNTRVKSDREGKVSCVHNIMCVHRLTIVELNNPIHCIELFHVMSEVM